jgi:hypothetical protein
MSAPCLYSLAALVCRLAPGLFTPAKGRSQASGMALGVAIPPVLIAGADEVPQ